MKNNTTIENALRNQHVLRAVPELKIDWNMNRYVGAVASNILDEETSGYSKPMFPIESIVEPNRPRYKGIAKARVGSSIVSDDYKSVGVRNGRYYMADEEDTYKYWTSPAPSNGSG